MTDKGRWCSPVASTRFLWLCICRDDLALGGYTAIMGPNGQAQAHAVDLDDAYHLLYQYYNLTYVRQAHASTHKHPDQITEICAHPISIGLRAWF